MPEEKRYSAAEIAAMRLPGLPTTKAKILARAEKEEWHYETKVGLGGVRRMFTIPPAYLPKQEGMHPSTEPAVLSANNADRIAAKAADTLGSQIDSERLARAIRILETYIGENNLTVTAQRKSEVTVVLYNYLNSNAGEAEVAQFLRLVA